MNLSMTAPIVLGAATLGITLYMALHQRGSHRDAGPKVSTDVQVGIYSSGGFVSLDLKSPNPATALGVDGTWALLVKVVNRGRQAAFVQQIDLEVDGSRLAAATPVAGRPVPFPVAANGQECWVFPWAWAAQLAEITDDPDPALSVIVHLGTDEQSVSQPIPLLRALEKLTTLITS